MFLYHENLRSLKIAVTKFCICLCVIYSSLQKAKFVDSLQNLVIQIMPRFWIHMEYRFQNKYLNYCSSIAA